MNGPVWFSTANRQQGQQGWYSDCYTEAIRGLTDTAVPYNKNAKVQITREDRIHGSLLVLAELLRYLSLFFHLVTIYIDTISPLKW